MEEAEYFRGITSSLIHAIRNNDDAQVLKLIRVIRNNASLNEIRAYIDTNLLRNDQQGAKNRQSPDENPLQVGTALIRGLTSTSPSRRKVMDVVELTKSPPLFDLPARPWTTVTDDDQLVSELMSLYFTWWNPFWNTVNQIPFIRSMKKKDLSSSLCSPCLVNCILALSCVSRQSSI